MSQIPVSPSDLDKIVYNVARDLIEERAVKGTMEDMSAEEVQFIVNDVVFIIDKYMYYINELMDNEKLIQSDANLKD